MNVGLRIYSIVFSWAFTSEKKSHSTSIKFMIDVDIGDITAGSISIVEKELT
jgi:hypothetical protein